MAKTQPASASDPTYHGHGQRPAEKFNPVEAIRDFARTSPWITIAIAVHVLLGAIAGIMHFSHEAKKEEIAVIAANIKTVKQEEELPQELPPEVIDRRAVPENTDAELVSEDVPNITLVDTLQDANEDLTKERGDPNSIDAAPGSTGGTPIGVGSDGHRGSGRPAAFATRTLGGGTGPPGRAGGPTERTQESVLRGLIWLARHQEPHGQWSAETFADLCPPDHPCQPETALENGHYTSEGDVGLTALSLLCYLGAGYGHDAKQFIVDTVNARKIRIGKDIVKPGLQWLVDHQNGDGSFTGGRFLLYNEAIAALALSEAYGLTQNNYWKEPAQKAIDFICAAQKPNPQDKTKLWGWRYQPADVVRDGPQFGSELSDADISVTGWMVMALKSAQVSGLKVPEKSIQGAMDFTRWSTGRKGLVGYVGPDTAGQPVFGEHDNFKYHVATMSSIGMCIRIFLEQDLKDPFLVDAANVLLNDLPEIGEDPKHPKIDYYYWYYGSLALNQLDGPDAPQRTNKYWGPWNKAMTDTIIALQDDTEGACTRGGWMQPDRWAYGFGPIYTTAINVLTLEVYYRYANAFGSKKEPGARASSADDKAEAGAPADDGQK